MLPTPQTLPALLAEISRTRSNQECAVEGPDRLTYGALNAKVEAEACALLAAGIKFGDRIAFFGEPSLDYWINFLAATSIGAIWLGLNPKYREQELAYILTDATPSLVRADQLEEYPDGKLALEAWATHPCDPPRILVSPNNMSIATYHAQGNEIPQATLDERRNAIKPLDTALIVYTSGSSGRPKGAMITHHGLTCGAKAQREIFTGEANRIICNFPINHIACVGDVCVTTLAGGGTLFFQRQFDPAQMLQTIADERITVLGGVPTMLQLIAATPGFAEADLSSLKSVIWGGAAMPPDAIAAFQAPGRQLIATYGMTETTANVTHTPQSDDIQLLSNSIGRTHPYFQSRVMVDDDREARVGEVGELQFHGDYLMKGYFNRPEATRDTFTADGWMKTGDLVEQCEDGMMRFVSRISEMYKSGGYNVYPREIEIALEEHDDVAMAAIIGVPDDLYQEVGHAFVMRMPGAKITPEDLEEFLRRHLANYKIPKQIIIEDMLPLLPVGKIDKTALRQRLTSN